MDQNQTFLDDLIGMGMPSGLAQIVNDGLSYYNSVISFGAFGDGVADDTEAIQLAIAFTYTEGGGVVFFPAGIYKFSAINLPSNVTLLGEGRKSTFLRCTSTTGNGITLTSGSANTSGQRILSLKLECLTSSTGIGISGPADPYYIADFIFNDYEIEGFQIGVYIPYGLQIEIGFGRFIGPGSAVANSVGIQLGDRTLSTPRLVNTAVVNQAYVSSYHTNFISDGSIQSFLGVTSENCTRAILCASRLSVEGSWIQATTTLLETRAGAWPVTFYACYFLNGASVEVDDVATMCTLGTAGDLSVFVGSNWKGDATFKYPFAVSAARGLALGTGATVATLHNASGTIRATSDSRALEVDRNASGAVSLFAFRQLGSIIGGIGVDASGNVTLLGSGLSAPAAKWNNAQNFHPGGGLLATTSTAGDLGIPTCAGTPTGVPTTLSGWGALRIDVTNNKLYFYSTGAWRDAGP